MTSPSTDAPPPTHRGAHSGRGAQVAVAAVLCTALVVLLVLPGFLAAGFSRMGMDYFANTHGEVTWDWEVAEAQYEPGMPAAWRVKLLLLAPSSWVLRRSPAARRFYSWEYRVAGGLNSHNPREW
ncbi:MAG TPA: hypothetical protein VG733_04045 [Chthoniobacteraceae bacterium]|nr:hypothetical protein [Chthoniobacteraceae bacterium]